MRSGNIREAKGRKGNPGIGIRTFAVIGTPPVLAGQGGMAETANLLFV
jgi:hypothetical protein